MGKGVNIKKIIDLIDEKPYDMNWFNYDLGGGWGVSLNKKSGRKKNRGAIIHGISRYTSIQQVIRGANNHDFDKIAGFYPAIFMFFGKKFVDKVDFCEDNGKNRLAKMIESQKVSDHLKDTIYEFLEQDFDFIEFLEACGRNENLNFNVDSAISAYKLQGDEAIFPILCQVFYVNKYCDGVSVALVDGLPVQLPVQVSNYLSGCHFPVAVSPYSDEFKWSENQNGHFLYTKYDDEWRVLDVAGVGRMNLGHYPLTNRLNFLGGGGEAVPYLICWNWGEIVAAYRHFGGSLLVRDLRNSLFEHYWFVFGLGSLIDVEYKDNLVNGGTNYAFACGAGHDLPTRRKLYVTLRLNGDFVRYCDKKDISFSSSEVRDWFELGEMLK